MKYADNYPNKMPDWPLFRLPHGRNVLSLSKVGLDEEYRPVVVDRKIEESHGSTFLSISVFFNQS